jgi:hypothetical protein
MKEESVDTQKLSPETQKKGNRTGSKKMKRLSKVCNAPDEDLLRKYSSLHATLAELSILLNVSVSVLERPVWRKIINEEREQTVYKLKKKATDMGLAGNATMLIFALKNIAKWSNNDQIQETSVKQTKTGYTIKVINKEQKVNPNDK